MTLGGKPIVSKDDVAKAHAAVLDKIKNTVSDNNTVKNIVNDTTKTVQTKYNDIQKHVDSKSPAGKLVSMGKTLHFNKTFKQLFNTNNFPLLLSCVIVFLIGWFMSYDYLQNSTSSYAILRKDSIIGMGCAIGVVSIMICYYFKYDIMTGLIIALILCIIMLMICQYTVIINYNALATNVNTEITPTTSDTTSPTTTSPTTTSPTTSDGSQSVCDPYGNFPPSCYSSASPSVIAAIQQMDQTNNIKYNYIEDYLNNQKRIVITYSVFIFIILGVYIVSYLFLYRFFPKYDRHICFLLSIGAGLLYIAHYMTTGYQPIKNNQQSVKRFQNLNENLIFLFGPNWASIFVWVIVLIFICFVILYWGARNLDITSNNKFFNSIFIIIVVLIISFSYVLFKQLHNQNEANYGNFIEGTNVVNKNILYIMIGLIALSILLMAGITRKIYKNTNK